MKFNCDIFSDWNKHRQIEKHNKLCKKRESHFDWNKKFAFLPIKIAHGDCRWLEFVETKIECETYSIADQYINGKISNFSKKYFVKRLYRERLK